MPNTAWSGEGSTPMETIAAWLADPQYGADRERRVVRTMEKLKVTLNVPSTEEAKATLRRLAARAVYSQAQSKEE